MIDELSDSILSVDQENSLVARLNKPGTDRLPAAWELIILWSLNRIGSLTHEIEHADGRRPDITFEGTEIKFVADITAISDKGNDERYGLWEFWQEIQRIVRKAKLNGNNFSLNLPGKWSIKEEKTEFDPGLPKPSVREVIIKDFISPFINRIRQEENSKELSVNREGMNFTLKFDRDQKYAIVGNQSYQYAGVLSRNPLINALEKKYKQVKSAGNDFIHGVIVCDGGCRLMKQKTSLWAGRLYSRRQVSEKFLRSSKGIDFVFLIGITENKNQEQNKRVFGLDVDLILSDNLDPSLADGLKKVLYKMLAQIPTLTNDPLNSANRCMLSTVPDMMGGLTYGGQMIKISSRALLRLLSGNLTAEDFMKAYGWGVADERKQPNPFQRAFEAGRLIKSVKIEESEKSDDDWLLIEFGEPDPASAPFVVKK